MDIPNVFHDITPIPQDDGPYPVCAIDYPPDFVQAMDYFRAILQTNEHSERTLRLSAICLSHNPANYTTWHFRRECLISLSNQGSQSDGDNVPLCINIDLIRKDLDLAAKLGGHNPKNYQIWYHRRSLLENIFRNKHQTEILEEDDVRLSLARDELDYIKTVLSHDSKNYHAWSYRQWIILTVDDEVFWNNEVLYAHKLIADDVRNNSAWNQRWFSTHHGSKCMLDIERAKTEVDYAIKAATVDPYNESPWTYLISVVKEQFRKPVQGDEIDESEKDEKSGASSTGLELLLTCEEEISKIDSILENDSYGPSVQLRATYIELLGMKRTTNDYKKAVDLVQYMIDNDPIRKKYWSMRHKEFVTKSIQI